MKNRKGHRLICHSHKNIFLNLYILCCQLRWSDISQITATEDEAMSTLWEPTIDGEVLPSSNGLLNYWTIVKDLVQISVQSSLLDLKKDIIKPFRYLNSNLPKKMIFKQRILSSAINSVFLHLLTEQFYCCSYVQLHTSVALTSSFTFFLKDTRPNIYLVKMRN